MVDPCSFVVRGEFILDLCYVGLPWVRMSKGTEGCLESLLCSLAMSELLGVKLFLDVKG